MPDGRERFLLWTCHSILPSESCIPCLPQGAVPIPAVPLRHSPTHSKLHWVCTKERLKANGGFNFNSFYESLLSGHRQQSPGHKSLSSLGSPFPELPTLVRKKKWRCWRSQGFFVTARAFRKGAFTLTINHLHSGVSGGSGCSSCCVALSDPETTL